VNEITKEVSKVALQIVHQYGGVVLGEHIGQIFTIAWTIMMTSVFSKWFIALGYLSSLIYLIAQTELFETVIPSFPVWNLAGFLGSTLWLIWLLTLGIKLQKVQIA